MSPKNYSTTDMIKQKMTWYEKIDIVEYNSIPRFD